MGVSAKLLACMLIAMVALGGPAVHAKQIWEKEVSGWEVNEQFDESSGGKWCVLGEKMNKNYSPGVIFAIQFYGDFVALVIMDSKQWKFGSGEVTEAGFSFRLGGVPLKPRNVRYDGEKQKLVAFLPADSSTFESIKSAKELTVLAPGTTSRFSLQGIGPAFEAALSCWAMLPKTATSAAPAGPSAGSPTPAAPQGGGGGCGYQGYDMSPSGCVCMDHCEEMSDLCEDDMRSQSRTIPLDLSNPSARQDAVNAGDKQCRAQMKACLFSCFQQDPDKIKK